MVATKTGGPHGTQARRAGHAPPWPFLVVAGLPRGEEETAAELAVVNEYEDVGASNRML